MNDATSDFDSKVDVVVAVVVVAVAIVFVDAVVAVVVFAVEAFDVVDDDRLTELRSLIGGATMCCDHSCCC